MDIKRLSEISTEEISLVLLFLFPLIIFSIDPYKNLDIRTVFICLFGLILLIFNIWQIFNKEKRNLDKSNKLFKLLLLVYIVSLFFSTILSIDILNSLIGGWSYRIGLVATLAFISCSYYVRNVKSEYILVSSFVTAILIAICSFIIDYSLLVDGFRLIGPVNQSNVLAVILGIGFVFGFGLYSNQNSKQKIILNILVLTGQTILLTGIILTQSRLLLALTIITSFVILFFYFKDKLFSKRTVITVLSLIGVLGIIVFLILKSNSSFNRLLSISLLESGIDYRIQLQSQGFRILTITPFYGWGPDSILYIYDKFFELPSEIQTSYVEDNQQVDSTHNTYLDKYLELGWLGGTVYLLLILLTLFNGIKNAKSKEDRLILLAFIFFSLQNLLNVTMIEQEIIYWILIMKLNSFKIEKDNTNVE
jgi:O-antigen ligase